MVHAYYSIFSRFSCSSMETWRRIRVGTRNYVIRVAGVSQEHVLVCTTRKVTRPENEMVSVVASKLTLLCAWSKWTWFQCGGSGLTSFQCRDQNWHGFVWSKMTWFRVWIEIILFFVSAGTQNWLVRRVGTDIHSTSGLESKTTWFCVGVEIDLVLVWWSKLTWFLCGGQNWPCFCVRLEN